MSVRRVTVVVGLAFYAFLWVLAANGVTSLVAVLVVPLVLVLMVWLGLALNRYLGLAPRRPHFRHPEDDPPR